MNIVYIAFDPGKTGGYAAIQPADGIYTEQVKVGIMPLIGKGKGADIDVPQLRKLLVDWKNFGVDRCVVFIENVHAIQQSGASTAFQFGRSLGILEGLVAGLNIQYVKVHSKTWQGFCFQGVTPIYKTNTKTKSGISTDTKAMAKIACNRLYPEVDLRKSLRAELPHDGIADALLICHYGKLNH